MSEQSMIATGLRATLDPVFERLDTYPRCFGTVDDFLAEVDDGRVQAVRVGGVPTSNLCAVHDARGAEK